MSTIQITLRITIRIFSSTIFQMIKIAIMKSQSCKRLKKIWTSKRESDLEHLHRCFWQFKATCCCKNNWKRRQPEGSRNPFPFKPSQYNSFLGDFAIRWCKHISCRSDSFNCKTEDTQRNVIILEYCQNESLYKFYNKHTFDDKRDSSIALDIAFGLNYLHESKIVHR